MKQMVTYGVILSAICLIAALVLAFTYQITNPIIIAHAEEEERSALRAVLPDAVSFRARQIDGMEYYEALAKDRLIGYCIKVVGHGYAGRIEMLMGIDSAGRIQGVKVLSHQETPGLGANITEIKMGDKDPWFLQQFIGKNARNVTLKDIDAITAATITSSAVVTAIKEAANEFFSKIKR